MQKEEILSLYNKHVRPGIWFRVLNLLISLIFMGMFFNYMTKSCSRGTLHTSANLKIAPMPLNDLDTKNYVARWEAMPNNAVAEQLRMMTDQKKKENLVWSKYFEFYAHKITIPNQKKGIFRAVFRLKSLPRNRPSYAELDFEIYSKDKDYLFTFYADNYWNQSGYDDGYWHEWNYSEKIEVSFPYAGDYYIIAGIPKHRRDLIPVYQRYTRNQVFFKLYKNISPISGFSSFLGFLIFLIISIVLMVRWHNSMIKNTIFSQLNFNNGRFLVLLKGEGKLADRLYYVSGYSRIGHSYSTMELFLSKDGETYFLEIEMEREENRSYFYHYLYDLFPEDEFPSLPGGATLNYNGEAMKRESDGGNKKVNIYYDNGMTESRKKTIINYGNVAETAYLSFEYEDDKTNFDVSYGRKIDGCRIWRIPQ